jgi:DNA-binding MarR family transcriptional regulator
MNAKANRPASLPPIPSGELAARRRVGDLDVDLPSMAAISNLFRLANGVRNYMERQVLRDFDLTFSGFTVLWVLWVMGSMETRHLAAEAGVTKGTLTGILKTLEGRGLVERITPETDRRLTRVHLTTKGEARMRGLFPRFNTAESDIVSALRSAEKAQFIATLRKLVNAIDGLERAQVVNCG